MSLADEIADDLDDFDGLASVAFTHVYRSGNYTNQVEALKRVRTSPEGMPGAYAASDNKTTTFHVKVSSFMARRPKPGDLIRELTADSLTGTYPEWKVTSVGLETLGTRYRFDVVEQTKSEAVS